MFQEVVIERASTTDLQPLESTQFKITLANLKWVQLVTNSWFGRKWMLFTANTLNIEILQYWMTHNLNYSF